MDPVEAMRRVGKAVGKEVMIYMPSRPVRYQFWSWDGKYKSHTGHDLTTLVQEIERSGK